MTALNKELKKMIHEKLYSEAKNLINSNPDIELTLTTKPTPEDLANTSGRPVKPDRRAYDSEVKILEDILDNTNPNSSGNIKIVTERDMCSSCSDALDQFRDLRPDIDVEVVFRKPYP